MPTIDTQVLARRRFERRDQPYQPKDLRLFNLRTTYGLPRYQAHNALSDALATAELFLALTADMAQNGHCRLNELMS
jgi:DNA polymerase-3 subunit epsilon